MTTGTTIFPRTKVFMFENFPSSELHAVAFWFMTPHTLAGGYHIFRETCCLHLKVEDR
jgi:hypothetical protein